MGLLDWLSRFVRKDKEEELILSPQQDEGELVCNTCFAPVSEEDEVCPKCGSDLGDLVEYEVREYKYSDGDVQYRVGIDENETS